ncbi:MAG: hypothetical protein KDE01_13440, partial [Caldilineaceae bacterium]|nr:hypothetical protein [Caldilineaceae bacterium]
ATGAGAPVGGTRAGNGAPARDTRRRSGHRLTRSCNVFATVCLLEWRRGMASSPKPDPVSAQGAWSCRSKGRAQ